MHAYLPKVFCFVDDFNKDYIKNLDKKIAIIFRNYDQKHSPILLKQLIKFCKKIRKKVFLANDIKSSLTLGFDGVYIPSFNKTIYVKNLTKINNFIVLGSAHNVKEVKEKEKQGVELIFLSPIFNVKKSKKNLGINRFNLIANTSKSKIIALGGVTNSNIKKMKILRAYGFASISLFKKKAPINGALFKYLYNNT
jgi:thiamine-phosphate pyrophosphorylase